MPSVSDAAINKAQASSSFSPLTLVKRALESTHISSGMLQMRVSVMELGRFTDTRPLEVPTTYLNYPPPAWAKQRKATNTFSTGLLKLPEESRCSLEAEEP